MKQKQKNKYSWIKWLVISGIIIGSGWYAYNKYYPKSNGESEDSEPEIKTETDLKNMLIKTIKDTVLNIDQKKQILRYGLIDSLKVYGFKLSEVSAVEVMAEISKYPELSNWNVNN